MALEPTSDALVLDVSDVDVRSLNGSRVYSSDQVLVRLLASAHRQEALLTEIRDVLDALKPASVAPPPPPADPAPEASKAAKTRRGA